ncbi:MAG: flagellar filament capping protein FliD [Bacteroidota bacterium]|nr:flagellar filament capping protein FliD [Bacteroidota bacterium]MDP4191321.1 flagellar filament capping protein FliD [Bacteroidota bacterium]MDP4195800.1 flagellar filament capping protein FliD [Bacteroidota bacterium]
MADILSTSTISDYVESYRTSEQDKIITPLTTQQTKYQKLSTSYTTLSSKILSLKTLLSNLKATGSSSSFSAKVASSSNSSFATATVSNTASSSAYSLRINQLAKSDIALSQALTSSTSRADLAGTHTFTIKAGDGTGGEYTSTVQVDLSSSETNQTVMEKIRDAMNTDKAIVTSSSKASTDAYAGGASSFKINLNGTETTISVNGGGTYSDLMDEMASQINSNVSGVIAEKVVDPQNSANYKLQLTVSDPSNYISISHVSGTDLVSDLNIGVTKEKAASSLVTASVFSPLTGSSQFSLTSDQTGLDYRITQLSDDSGGQALSALGLNLGTTRTASDQTNNISGFVYADTSLTNNLLNAKLNFNGVDVQRNSNAINDLATGVTFNLKSVMQSSDATVNITASNDITTVKTKIQDFITKFNDLYSFIKSNTGSKDGVRGTLISDSNSTSLMSILRSIPYQVVSGLPSSSLNKLGDIGITFDTYNGLTISNSSTLDDVLTNKASQVESIFNSDNGIANSLYNAINPYTGSAGYLTSTKSSFDRNITRINDQITAAQNRIDKSAENLRNRYQEMQVQLASLYSTQSYFSSSGFFSS